MGERRNPLTGPTDKEMGLWAPKHANERLKLSKALKVYMREMEDMGTSSTGLRLLNEIKLIYSGRDPA